MTFLWHFYGSFYVFFMTFLWPLSWHFFRLSSRPENECNLLICSVTICSNFFFLKFFQFEREKWALIVRTKHSRKKTQEWNFSRHRLFNYKFTWCTGRPPLPATYTPPHLLRRQLKIIFILSYLFTFFMLKFHRWDQQRGNQLHVPGLDLIW